MYSKIFIYFDLRERFNDTSLKKISVENWNADLKKSIIFTVLTRLTFGSKYI